jgi:hypothetical protein
MDNNSSLSIISSLNSSSQRSFSSLTPQRKNKIQKKSTNKRKRTGMINPSLTYAEYNFLKDLAHNKVDDSDKYSDSYQRVLKHRLRHKFPAVMEMVDMMIKVTQEKKI